MPILGENEAIQFTVPEASGTQAPLSIVFTGTSQSIDLTPLAPPTGTGTGRFLFVTWVASEDCHLVFTKGAGTATTASWPVFKGQEYNRIINLDRLDTVSVVQDSASGRFWIGRTSP